MAPPSEFPTFSDVQHRCEHLELLYRLTSAFNEVATRARLAELVRDAVAKALCATSIAVVDIASGEPLVANGTGVEALCKAALVPVASARWSNGADDLADAPDELRAYAVVPVAVGTRRLATLALGFAEQRFAATYCALVDDVSRQLAVALDRVISFERLEQERQRVESTSGAKDEFLALLGHELRNPLSPILTATQLMRMRGEDICEKERTVIERQVKQMIRLVDDLLDVSRITRGKLELRPHPVEISEVIAQAVELSSPALDGRGQRLTLDVPSTGVVVLGDPGRLAQVFANLLSNAAKRTPQGGSIHVAAHSFDSTIAIAVRDAGTRIDPKLLGHMFELFAQRHQGSDRACGGLGLGLAIAKTLVELHDGTIQARNAGSGQGSEIVVELPRYATAVQPARTATSSAAACS